MQRGLNIAAILAVLLAFSVILVANLPARVGLTLINVSYDPTRELYALLNERFIADYAKATGQSLVIQQSHGGSSRQARAVIQGDIAADVVTLGLASDIDALAKHGLLARDWADRLPNHAQPYSSTIVFVVRRGNPHQIHDWPDLLQPGIEIVTPSPKTSGNGKLSVLAAWGAIVTRGGSEAQALDYLTRFYAHVPVLAEGARGAAISFAQSEMGDVHLTWENEARREVAESAGKLELVYPPVSILAEPRVAWVDANLARHGTADAARAYLNFLFSDPAQEIMARLGYRPYKPEILHRPEYHLPDITLFPVTAVARDWNEAQEKFFGENGIIDLILKGRQS